MYLALITNIEALLLYVFSLNYIQQKPPFPLQMVPKAKKKTPNGSAFGVLRIWLFLLAGEDAVNAFSTIKVAVNV